MNPTWHNQRGNDEGMSGGRITRGAIVALLFSVSPALPSKMSYIGILDTLLDFVGFVTANCVQHYEEGLKPEAVAKLHFSETEIAAYCVCSTKLLVGEMDERDLKTLEAGKVGNVLMSFCACTQENSLRLRKERCGTLGENNSGQREHGFTSAFIRRTRQPSHTV